MQLQQLIIAYDHKINLCTKANSSTIHFHCTISSPWENHLTTIQIFGKFIIIALFVDDTILGKSQEVGVSLSIYNVENVGDIADRWFVSRFPSFMNWLINEIQIKIVNHTDEAHVLEWLCECGHILNQLQYLNPTQRVWPLSSKQIISSFPFRI